MCEREWNREIWTPVLEMHSVRLAICVRCDSKVRFKRSGWSSRCNRPATLKVKNICPQRANYQWDRLSILYQYSDNNTAPGVCSRCVCMCGFTAVCVQFGWDKCRAQIPSMGHHTWPYVTSLIMKRLSVVKLHTSRWIVLGEFLKWIVVGKAQVGADCGYLSFFF